MNKIQEYSFDLFDSKQYFFSMSKLSELLGIETKSLPISILILLENVLRHCRDMESLENIVTNYLNIFLLAMGHSKFLLCRAEY